MYAEERQQAMAQLINAERRVSVARLAEDFSVTTETVRRDLSALERRGLVRRVHGGAVPVDALAPTESGLNERDQHNTDAKEGLAAAAIALLPAPGSTILLDAGSTTARLVAALPHDHQLTVVTHSVPLAARLAGNPNIELVLLPGRVRPTTQAAVGADTVAALAEIRVDMSFVGANGLSVEFGLSTPDRDEAATKRALVAAGRRTVALVDSSKLGLESTHRFARLSDVDVLVTDAGIDAVERSELERHGLEVVVA
ncbi:DeoR/GlpR family DNA-binding transcription regulator [Nocardioides yefusunii]|uniref:Lactose phosphotransferase system repressor n=1 Tax=Nocardioides yefusunii TaxID=2500546 RepID=A0ABW1QV38_9ACTN|nr:DeoR/GlpR family DNA-binding transcription regulator [Nocardioides yefusunii]